MSVSGTIRFQPLLEHSTTSGLSTPTETVISQGSQASWSVTDGTGANQMDLLWQDQRTLALSTSENLDLAGSLTNSFGATMTFARVKFIYVAAASGNGSTVSVGGAAANTFTGPFSDATDIIQIRAGGAFMITAPDATGYAVTAGTGDILKVTNDDGAASATYDIVIGGASA